MRLKYWAVHWGGVTRLSNRCGTREEACNYCFGVALPDMTAIPFPKNPRYMSAEAKAAFAADLIKAHNQQV